MLLQLIGAQWPRWPGLQTCGPALLRALHHSAAAAAGGGGAATAARKALTAPAAARAARGPAATAARRIATAASARTAAAASAAFASSSSSSERYGFAAGAYLAAAAAAAAAAALAAAAAPPFAALADAAADDDDAAGADLGPALADAKLHLDRAWAELTDDWARAAAMRPKPPAASGSSAAAPPPPPPPPTPPRRPTVELEGVGGGAARRLRVTLPVRPGADGAAVVREIGAALQALARCSVTCSQRHKAHVAGGSSVHRWDVAHAPAGGSVTHNLSVEARLPLRGGGGGSGSGGDKASGGAKGSSDGGDGGDGEDSGRVVFVKDGALLPAEKAAVTRALRAANLTFAERATAFDPAPPPALRPPPRGGFSSGLGAGGAELDPLSAAIASAERLFANEIARLPGFGDLVDFFDFLEQRAAELRVAGLLGDDDDDDDDDEEDGDGDEEGGVPGGGEFGRAWREHVAAARAAREAAGWRPVPADAGADAAATAAAERRRREEEAAAAAAAAAEEAARRPWATPEGRRAVQALEALGARVYLPEAETSSGSSSSSGGSDGSGDAGGKGAAPMDWGALAGYEEQKRAIEDTLLLVRCWRGPRDLREGGTGGEAAATTTNDDDK